MTETPDAPETPETIETLGRKIASLAAMIDKRFAAVDMRFDGVDKRFDGVDKRFDGVDKRFDELKAELRTEIEAVDAKVGLVLEKVDDLITRDMRHTRAHVRFEMRLDNHELRLLALETKKTKPDNAQ